jgi:hypothetical protein
MANETMTFTRFTPPLPYRNSLMLEELRPEGETWKVLIMTGCDEKGTPGLVHAVGFAPHTGPQSSRELCDAHPEILALLGEVEAMTGQRAFYQH